MAQGKQHAQPHLSGNCAHELMYIYSTYISTVRVAMRRHKGSSMGDDTSAETAHMSLCILCTVREAVAEQDSTETCLRRAPNALCRCAGNYGATGSWSRTAMLAVIAAHVTEVLWIAPDRARVAVVGELLETP